MKSVGFRRSYAPSPTRLSDRASSIHQDMREWWEKTHGTGYDDQMLSQLARVLFMKRKRVETGDASQPDFAFAPQEETWRAIRDVLELRQRYLRSKGIKNPLHVLNSDQRAEFTKGVREDYEESEEQQKLQRNDVEKGLAKGKSKAKSKGRGKGFHARDSPGSLAAFLREQRRKRWCRHMQRACGTKQIWEILAFTGRFDASDFRATLASRPSERDGDTEEAMHDDERKKRRRLLQNAKEQAKARYNEGRRLARQRDTHRDRSGGASQPAWESGSSGMRQGLSFRQTVLLEDFRSGRLMMELNERKVAWGHGRLRDEAGGHMDIGGSTGGGSRRIIDDWAPPDCQDFLAHAETVRVCARARPKKR